MQRQGSLLTPDQAEQVDQLVGSLRPEQAIWLSGYFAALGDRAGATLDAPMNGGCPGKPGPAAENRQLLTVLFGSETGNAKQLARALADAASNRGIEARQIDMADYRPRALKDEQDLLVITSTHGEGDPPQTALGFFEFLEGRRAPALPQLRFAVLGLGDSTYEHYCAAARRVDERLAGLGAQRLVDRVECDVDYEEPAAKWIRAIVAKLSVPGPPASPAVPAVAVTGNGAIPRGNGAAAGSPLPHDRKHPFQAPVLENIVLTGRGSSKETRHLELSLEGSGLSYRPGDALGVVPRNDPALVEALLEQLGLAAEAPVTLRQETMPLGDALSSAIEITSATPRFLDQWAELTGAPELHALRAPDQSPARTAFLHGHHILDIVERFPAPGIEPDQLLAGLRPLQPRLYSLASSFAAAPEEAHLTVSTVRFALHGRARVGVASGYLAGRTEEDETVPVYVHANDHFHLPDDDTPVLMIGAGTGVAPYRAFMQERDVRGATGRSWLFFGERNFRSDFLYQVEWQDLLRRGVLTRLDLAFSRDARPKTYVQDRLRLRGHDVYAWLEEGAWLYVCGDAARMAPDVHAALVDVVAEHGGLDRQGAEDYLAGLRRDRRYRLDVD
jgi:sulfite reductase (NADPH) flavoprotein alpha-component